MSASVCLCQWCVSASVCMSLCHVISMCVSPLCVLVVIDCTKSVRVLAMLQYQIVLNLYHLLVVLKL